MTSIVRRTQGKPYVPGKIPYELSAVLPAGYRIDGAFAVIKGTLNVPLAGATSAMLTKLVSLIECERRLRIDGLGSSALDWLTCGKDHVRPADIAQNAAAPIELAYPLAIGRDERGVEPSDSAPATDFYAGKFLEVTVVDPTTLLAALAVNAGTEVFLEFHLSPLPDGAIPTSTVLGYVDYAGKETILPGGVDYIDICLTKNDGSNVTDAELGNIRLNIDNRLDIVESNTRLATLVRKFNRYIAKGAQVQGATDGVEGEAMDLASVPFAPLWHPMPPYKGTKLTRAEKRATLYTDGTLAVGAAKVWYRVHEVRDEANALKAAAKLYPGRLTRESVIEAKTVSKNGVGGWRGFLSGVGSRVRGLRPR